MKISFVNTITYIDEYLLNYIFIIKFSKLDYF